MSQPIRPETAQKIYRVVTDICDRGDEHSAHQYAVKLAKERDLTPGHIELVCQSFNAGNINSARTLGSSLQEKLAACELLDAEKIIAAVYPTDSDISKAAAEDAVAPIYSAKPTREKAASCQCEGECDCGCESKDKKSDKESKKSKDSSGDSGTSKSVKVISIGVDPLGGLLPSGMPEKKLAAKKAAAEIREGRDAIRHKERVANIKLAEAVDTYRRVFDNDMKHLPWVHEIMTWKQGAAGGAVADLLAENLVTGRDLARYHNEKQLRAGTLTKEAAEVLSPHDFMNDIIKHSPFPVRSKHEAFGKLDETLDAYQDWFKVASEFPQFAFKKRREIEKLTGRVKNANLSLPGKTQEETDDYLFEKRAFNVGGMLGGLTGAGMASMGRKQGKPDSGGLNSDVLRARLQLNDPAHDAELKRLEAEMAINRLIADDEVISNYTTEEVADAFDSLDQSTPGITDNPLLMRANIRRQLQGDVTPFEADAALQTAERADRSQKMLPMLTVSAAGK